MQNSIKIVSAHLLACLTITAMTAVAQDKAGDERYYTGNALYNRKMYKLAIEEYKLFLTNYPAHTKIENARLGMAMCYYSLGDHANAEPALKALITKGEAGNKNQLRVLRAQSLLKLDKVADAEKQFAELIGTEAAKTFKLTALAGILECQYKQKKWSETIATADSLLSENAAGAVSRRALYQAAYASHQLKKFKEAIPYLEKLQPMPANDPLKHQASFFLGESYRMTGDLENAVKQYKISAKGFKGAIAAEIYYRLGFVSFKLKNYEDAISAFGSSLKSEPDGEFSGEAYLYSGRCYLEEKNTEKAVEFLEALVDGTKKINASDKITVAEAGLWRARIYSRAGAHAKAAAYLGELVPKMEKSPLLPDILFDQANALIAEKKYAEASKALAGVMRKADWPQMNDTLRLLAVCLHHNKDFAGSLKQADSFIAKYKNDKLVDEVLFVRAENLYFLDKTAEAQRAYDSFIKTYPKHRNSTAAAFRVSQIHHGKGDWGEALKSISSLIPLEPRGKLFSQMNFIAGDCHFREKNWKEAITYLTKFNTAYPVKAAEGEQATQKEPNADSAVIELAISHLKTKNNELAIKYFQDIVIHCKQSPHLPLALSELGRLYYEDGRNEKARKVLSVYVNKFKDDTHRPKAEYYLGWIALADKNEEKAESHFKTVTESYPKDTLASDSLLQLGLVQLSQKKHAEAQKAFTKLTSTYPKHPQLPLAIFSLGVSHARAKNWDAASPHFQNISTKYQDSEYAPRALYELAWCAKGSNKKKDAIKHYEKLLKTYPNDKLTSKVKTELAELTFDAKDYDKVITQLKETLTSISDPKLKEQTTYRLGTAYFNTRNFEESGKVFAAFTKEFPESSLMASAHFQAGESFMQGKETILARKHFLEASKIESLDAAVKESVLIRLGETQGLTKQWPEASETYAAFLEAYPKSQWIRNARFGYAWSMENQKQYRKALAEYEKVIDKGEDVLSARAQFQIGECLFASKKYDEAIKALIPVQIKYRYKDWAAKALLETGRIMEAKGDRASAIDQFKEVIKKFPDHDAAIVAKKRLDAIRVGN